MTISTRLCCPACLAAPVLCPHCGHSFWVRAAAAPDRFPSATGGPCPACRQPVSVRLVGWALNGVDCSLPAVDTRPQVVNDLERIYRRRPINDVAADLAARFRGAVSPPTTEAELKRLGFI